MTEVAYHFLSTHFQEDKTHTQQKQTHSNMLHWDTQNNLAVIPSYKTQENME